MHFYSTCFVHSSHPVVVTLSQRFLLSTYKIYMNIVINNVVVFFHLFDSYSVNDICSFTDVYNFTKNSEKCQVTM